MNSPVVFTSEQLTILNTLNQAYLSGSIPSLNASNTATSNNAVTINALSGIATFTDAVSDSPLVSTYVIYNSFVTTSTRAIVNISATQEGVTLANLGVYFGDGVINVQINNGIASSALGFPIIDFMILNA